ncbi:MAG TPA: hypothetical protein VK463_18875 [Desulfomonilaceae bacterium]|nr:hypothetical protein [Desulfomonilaceae bacterium]
MARERDRFSNTFWTAPWKMGEAFFQSLNATALYWQGIHRYSNAFVHPMLQAYMYFLREQTRKLEHNDSRNVRDYAELSTFSMLLAAIVIRASLDKALKYHFKEYINFLSSVVNTVAGRAGGVDTFMTDTVRSLHTMVIDFPEAVRNIRKEYGFHFDDGKYVQVAETERMLLYQVLPTDPGVTVDPEIKPVLIAHPYVLGPNILAFLPGERKSYVHSFANESIPTYVRIIKDISSNSAVQVMTGEDDALDTRYFARILMERHGKPVTLNGVCQGGFILLADLLSGQLDGFVDALITAASPIDGTRSPGLTGYLDRIPSGFKDLVYATKVLPNGNKVIDGEVMSWVYKLKSLDKEFSLSTFYKDLDTFEQSVRRHDDTIGKTMAAINYWLVHDRTDLPVEITNLSKLSYTVPISHDGDLPFTLFGRRLNLKHIAEQRISYLVCYGAQDNLVEPASATAALDFIDAESTEFPKGHAAIFTSWTQPESEYALHKIFPNGQRGPVRFHLDLDEASPDACRHKQASGW